MPKVNQSFRARMESSAATEAPLALESVFAMAVCIQDASGQNLVNQQLLVLDNKRRVVGEVYTDQNGPFVRTTLLLVDTSWLLIVMVSLS